MSVKVKTAELIGPALDWAVGHALGAVVKGHKFCAKPGSYVHPNCTVFPDGSAATHWRPSTDWSQGGPLIEKFHVQTSFNGCGFSRSPTGEHWCAYACNDSGEEMRPSGSGPTPLIAAMHAIVAAKLGDEVEVPEALVSQ